MYYKNDVCLILHVIHQSADCIKVSIILLRWK